MRLIELSHIIEDGMITYPGLPAPRISDHLSREASASRYVSGTTFHIGQIELIANTGTYLDAPFHRYAGGEDVAAIGLERLAFLEGVTIDVAEGVRAIDAVSLKGLAVKGRAVLVRTGWSRHFGRAAYGSGHPYLTADAARHLIERQAALVGIDSLNIDDTAHGTRAVHSALLGAGIPIVEHLTNLSALPASGFRFFAAPPRIRGLGSFPVRAFAMVEDARSA